jgi:hypothetical protein
MPYREHSSRELVQSDEDKRAEQYQDVGIYIVTHCHVLLALWNGEEGGPTGGTSQIVEYKRNGIPLDLSKDARTALDGSEIGPVIEIMTPRKKADSPQVKVETLPWGIDSTGRDNLAIRLLKGFFTFIAHVCCYVPHPDRDQVRRTWRVFEAITTQTCRFNAEVAALVRDSARTVDPDQCLTQLFADASNKPNLPAQGQAENSAPYWCSLYKLAEAAAQVRQKQFKLDWSFLFGAGFFALVIFEIFAHLIPKCTPLLAVYFLAFFCAFVWFAVARYREHQERYLDYRALAEALRIAVYWKLAGMTTNVADAYPVKQVSELAWVKIVLRIVDMFDVVYRPEQTAMTGDSLALIRDLWIDGQKRYFERQGSRHHKTAEIWEARSLALLALSPIAGAALMLWNPANEHDVHVMIVFMGLFAGSAALVAGFIEKLAYHAHARQYDRMQLLFEHALAQVSVPIPAAKIDDVKDFYVELGKEAMKENADWVAIYRQRPIRPAG